MADGTCQAKYSRPRNKSAYALIYIEENSHQHGLIWHDHGLWTPNEAFFSLKSRTFGLGQTNWADKFWGIWGIFGHTINTHFGTVSPLSMFSIIQPLFLQKLMF